LLQIILNKGLTGIGKKPYIIVVIERVNINNKGVFYETD